MIRSQIDDAMERQVGVTDPRRKETIEQMKKEMEELQRLKSSDHCG